MSASLWMLFHVPLPLPWRLVLSTELASLERIVVELRQPPKLMDGEGSMSIVQQLEICLLYRNHPVEITSRNSFRSRRQNRRP